MTQVHKESLTIIENALPNRSGLEVEIFGMEGIPGDVAFQHQQRVLQNFAQAEAERRAATGNPPPGTIGGTQPKKPKFESPADLKMRLAEHKAKMAVQAAGAGSGESTPTGAAQSPGVSDSFVVYTRCHLYIASFLADARMAGGISWIRTAPDVLWSSCNDHCNFLSSTANLCAATNLPSAAIIAVPATTVAL